MRNKIIKSIEQQKQSDEKKRNYNRYYYHLVRKNKNKIIEIKEINNTLVNIQYGKFIVIF